jgi:hypothetical protein
MAVLLVERDAEIPLWDDDERGADTLDDVLSGSWDGLAAAGSPSACPVCGGVLEPRWSAGAGIVGGRCRDCGSELS